MILTKEQADNIVAKNDKFISKTINVDGYNITMYNYRLANYEDFNNPMLDNSLQAFELRGLTFVEQEDKTFKHFLHLHKFFNLNQTTNYMYEDVINDEVVQIQDKLDGSMIVPILLPNNKMLLKTKYDLFNDQTNLATHFVNNNKNYYEFIMKCLDKDIIPIFELISPFNQIVINYHDNDMKLLQLRDNKTGVYYNIYEDDLVKEYNIKTTETLPIVSIDELMNKVKSETGIEGYVFSMINKKDGGMKMLKLKTDWYRHLHGLITENANKENYVIASTLNETIDDILAEIPKTNQISRNFILTISDFVAKHMIQQTDEIYNLLKENYKGDRKAFALEFKNHPYFGLMMSSIKNDSFSIESIEKNVKLQIEKNTNKLEKAKTWLKQHGIENLKVPSFSDDG